MERLKKRGDFVAAAAGPRVAGPAFTLQSRTRDDRGPIRVGFTVTRKVGTATERNRVKRRLREMVKRLDVTTMQPHHDYVVIGRRAALDRGFETMIDDLRGALLRLTRQKPSHAKKISHTEKDSSAAQASERHNET